VRFSHALKAAWALLSGLALLMVGTGLQGSLLGLRATIEGFSTTTTGVIMSSYYLGFVIGSLRAPAIVARVGHVRAFAALASIASSAVLIHAVAVIPVGWILLRVISGFCMAGLYVIAESWLNDAATNETRGSLLSIYMVVISGGISLGQILLNAADPAGTVLFVVTSVLVSLALVPTALSAGSSPRLVQPEPVSTRDLMRAAPLGVIGVGLAGMSAGALYGVGVVYAQLSGLSIAATSVLMFLAILLGTLLQWPIGAVSDRLDRRKVIAATAAVAAAAALVGTTGPTGVLLLLVFSVAGGLSLTMYALFNAHVNDWLEPTHMVGAGSRLLLINGIGAMSGPLVASIAMTIVGPPGFFWMIVIANAAAVVYALWRLTRRGPVPADQQSTFVTVPARGTSTMVSVMNPEVWDDQGEPIFVDQTPDQTPDQTIDHTAD
jgi:MFS family permease